MRIYNPQTTNTLLPELREALTRLRCRRGFEVQRYVEAKAVVLNAYLRESRLNACVVGVSGGVDSAIVLALAAHAKTLPDSPIQKILAVAMPVFDVGATHQNEALARGLEVARRFGAEPIELDLTASHAALKTAVDSALNRVGEPWASGQLVSYVRTPALYYITSLLTQSGYASVLLGTTNRDEGGYLGYIGKASDGMVDIQLISDLHKSEVYAVAHYFQVPKSVLNATPTGDMYDARADEEVFGAPYDFVELYLLYKEIATLEEQRTIQQDWSEEAREQFSFFARNLEDLHRYNRHKYLGKSPAVHLDILPASTPDGWNNSPYLSRTEPPIVTSRINGLFTLDERTLSSLHCTPTPEITKESVLDFGDSALILNSVVDGEAVETLLKELSRASWVPVGVNGMKKDFNPETDAVGSWRATAYSPEFALALWNRIRGYIGSPRIMDAKTPTDWDGTQVWRAVGINPMLRFVRYQVGNLLIPHYDAPFVYHDGKRTLVSVILYLEGIARSGGATRLIRDPQSQLPVAERGLDDWTRPAADEEVLLRIVPKMGSCLIFDHRILHDAEACSGDKQKTILRTDIIFERCGAVPSL